MIFGSDKFPAQEDLAGSRRSARAVGGFPGLVASEAAGMAGDGSAMVAGRAQAEEADGGHARERKEKAAAWALRHAFDHVDAPLSIKAVPHGRHPTGTAGCFLM